MPSRSGLPGQDVNCIAPSITCPRTLTTCPIKGHAAAGIDSEATNAQRRWVPIGHADENKGILAQGNSASTGTDGGSSAQTVDSPSIEPAKAEGDVANHDNA
jgi:hypothetical protein